MKGIDRRWMLLVLVAAVLMVHVTGCSSRAAPTVEDLPRSMKGYELYSWQEGGEWHFALLTGTNRIKEVEEVMSSETRVRGLGKLRETLGRLREGEQVFWLATRVPGMALPDGNLVGEVQAWCSERGVDLYIVR
jgi:hypothetical protein